MKNLKTDTTENIQQNTLNLNYSIELQVNNFDPYKRDYIEVDQTILNLIIKIVKEKLGRDDIDIYTNFFDLGATSLQVFEAWKQLVSETNIDFSIVKIFENSSIQKLARFLSDNQTQGELEIHDIEKQADKQREALQNRMAARRNKIL